MPACLSYFLFCCCNKMPWQKQVKEKGIYLDSWGYSSSCQGDQSDRSLRQGHHCMITLACSTAGKVIRKVWATLWWFYSWPWQDTWGEELEGKGFTLSHSLTIMVGKAWSLEYKASGHLHLHPWHGDKWMLGFISLNPHSVTTLWDCKTKWVFPLEWNLWKHLTDTPRDMLPWWFYIQSCWQWRLTSQHIIPKYCLILCNWTWLLVWNYTGTRDNLDLHLLSKGL